MSINTGDKGSNPEIKRLFANCDCGTTDYEFIGTVINPSVFAENFPSDPDGPGWELYSNTTFESDLSNRTFKPLTSYAWRGKVATVDNIPYGVSDGMTVEIVFLFVSVPGSLIVFPDYD